MEKYKDLFSELDEKIKVSKITEVLPKEEWQEFTEDEQAILDALDDLETEDPETYWIAKKGFELRNGRK